MERTIKTKGVLGSSWGTRRNRFYKLGCLTGLRVIFLLTVSVLLISCTTLKKAAIVSSLGTTGALVGNAVSGTAGLVVGGVTTAFVADVVTEVKMPTKASATVLQTEQGMIECAPDNFFTLLGKLVEMGGWLLVLIFVVPMILGWILPGPLTTHGKKRKERNLFS